jgi:hypothetical protein
VYGENEKASLGKTGYKLNVFKLKKCIVSNIIDLRGFRVSGISTLKFMQEKKAERKVQNTHKIYKNKTKNKKKQTNIKT